MRVLRDNLLSLETWAFNYKLQKHEGIIWFSTSPKEPLTSLESHKCLDYGQMHGMNLCSHNTLGCSINKITLNMSIDEVTTMDC